MPRSNSKSVFEPGGRLPVSAFSAPGKNITPKTGQSKLNPPSIKSEITNSEHRIWSKTQNKQYPIQYFCWKLCRKVWIRKIWWKLHPDMNDQMWGLKLVRFLYFSFNLGLWAANDFEEKKKKVQIWNEISPTLFIYLKEKKMLKLVLLLWVWFLHIGGEGKEEEGPLHITWIHVLFGHLYWQV